MLSINDHLSLMRLRGINEGEGGGACTRLENTIKNENMSWYLYEIVSQFIVRTHEEKCGHEKIIRFVAALHLIECLI